MNTTILRSSVVAVLLWGGAMKVGAADSLPLIEYPVARAEAAAPLIVLVSGDGGWAEIDQQLAERWQARGWPVVGFNALKYFWKKRSPEEFTRAVADVITSHEARFGRHPVVLVGFSFGAVVVPFACNRLPDRERGKVRAMVLISPTENSVWEVGMSSWFGGGEEGPPVAPELAKLDPLPVLLLTGERDPDAFHHWARRPGLLHEKWPGDHHLDREFDRIDETVVQFLQAHRVGFTL